MKYHLNKALLAGLLLCGTSLAWAETAAIPAISKPSEDVVLGFSRQGRIAKVLVKDGDAVTKDQPLVQQDNREEQALMEQDVAKAGDVTELRAQEAMRDQKKVDLKRIEWAYQQGGVKSQFELDAARMEVVVAEARVKIAEFEHEQAIRKATQSTAMVDKMIIKSPFAGVVEQIMAKEGESTELQTKVIRVVNIDPLWVEVPVPYAHAREIKKGDAARVIFSDKSDGKGEIIHIGAVADAGSDTLMIRVKLANPSQRQAGEQVKVEFGTAKVAQGR